MSPGSHAAPVPAAEAVAAARPDRPAGPLQVLSVTPAADAKGVNGAAPIRVRFSARLAANTPMPALSPHIAGSWQVEGDTAVFTPASGYFQNTRVTLKVPGGPDGMISAGRASAGTGGLLVSSLTQSFTTGSLPAHCHIQCAGGYLADCFRLPQHRSLGRPEFGIERTHLRASKMFHLRRDPFERAD